MRRHPPFSGKRFKGYRIFDISRIFDVIGRNSDVGRKNDDHQIVSAFSESLGYDLSSCQFTPTAPLVLDIHREEGG